MNRQLPLVQLSFLQKSLQQLHHRRCHQSFHRNDSNETPETTGSKTLPESLRISLKRSDLNTNLPRLLLLLLQRESEDALRANHNWVPSYANHRIIRKRKRTRKRRRTKPSPTPRQTRRIRLRRDQLLPLPFSCLSSTVSPSSSMRCTLDYNTSLNSFSIMAFGTPLIWMSYSTM